MHRKLLFGLIVVVALATVTATSGATPGARSLQTTRAARPFNLDPLVTFSATNHGGTQAVISTHGNLISYFSPNSSTSGHYEHVGVGAFSEGYVLCYTNPSSGRNVDAFDTGSSESGFGASTTTLSPVTVTRTTSDGVLRLKQTISFDAATNSVFFTMVVTNLKGVRVRNIVLRRQVDFDTDTGGANGWATFENWHANDTHGSVWAWNAPASAPAGDEAHNMVLRNYQTHVEQFAYVTGDILDNSCNADSKLPSDGPHFGDYGDTLMYPLGSLAAHASTNAGVQYLRL
jgi:hypothetical protein